MFIYQYTNLTPSTKSSLKENKIWWNPWWNLLLVFFTLFISVNKKELSVKIISLDNERSYHRVLMFKMCGMKF